MLIFTVISTTNMRILKILNSNSICRYRGGIENIKLSLRIALDNKPYYNTLIVIIYINIRILLLLSLPMYFFF